MLIDGLAAGSPGRPGCQALVPRLSSHRPSSPGVWLRMQLLEQSGQISRAQYSQVLSTHVHRHRQLHVCAHEHSGYLGCRSTSGEGQNSLEPHKKIRKEVKDWAGSSQCVRIHLQNINDVSQNIFKILERRRRYGNKQIRSRFPPQAE